MISARYIKFNKSFLLMIIILHNQFLILYSNAYTKKYLKWLKRMIMANIQKFVINNQRTLKENLKLLHYAYYCRNASRILCNR